MGSKEFDRRLFLKGAATVGAAAVTAGLAGCQASGSNATSAASAAVAEALTTATSTWSFEVAPDPVSEDQITATETADVVVIGAGTSGLVTALSCLDNGVGSVILISASSAPVSRGGSNNAVYSKVMQQMGLSKPDAKVFYRKEAFANSCNFNQTLWYRHYNNSEEAMNWMIDHMAEAGVKTTVESCGTFAPDDLLYQAPGAHAYYKEEAELNGGIGMLQAYAVNALADLVTKAGGAIYYDTTAVQLVREDDNTGRVVAVIATGKDGAYIKYEGTKAVVMATGDFSHNKDMMAKYCPQALPLLAEGDIPVDYNLGFGVGGLMPGDGQKMGLWIGAAWQVAQPNCMMLYAPFPIAQPYTAHTGLMMNANGERFMNEDTIGAMASAALTHQPGKTAYCIWSSNYAEDGGPWHKSNFPQGSAPFTTEELVQSWTAAGYATGNTIEEVVSALGLPDAAVDTVNRYNEFCATGEDTEFYKNPHYLVGITEPPFYGGTTSDMFLTVLGGLRTDTHLRVCDKNDQPIPGLFNVGTMIGDMFANIYTFEMEGINYGAACTTLPYLLGKELASGELDA
ncbi:MAG: FAD-dependent oxidoreductase [Actinobacteria bacterium]|nr:FAD-dependent oxidoreductase [Actinomycetota bacterium]